LDAANGQVVTGLAALLKKAKNRLPDARGSENDFTWSQVLQSRDRKGV
jgi:hypothetical protein